MDHFVVSARKYRPATFDTVVGQSHVTQTLKNAIRSNHLAHAFLFCGPRGVGKTTCARILAKTINCQNMTADVEPCNQCDSCLAFNNSSSFNIYELDAASNNSVEDIRGLVDQVRYAPQGAKYKIYIIDEVHMLSTAAFNAFLKTLEEPPPYAIFILATTEKHKILPTILSRCQIFDFKRIRVQDSVDHLKSICAKEGINAEDDAMHVVAQKAEGALRDALSIFDRIVSFSGNHITYHDVIANLNILDYDYYFRIIDLFYRQDLAKTMLLFDEILGKGFDAHQFLIGISEHLRNLLMCKDPQTVKLMEVSDNVAQRYLEQAKTIPASFILNAINIVNQFDINYKSSKNQRLHVELCLMKLCYLQSLIDTKNLAADNGPDKKKTDIASETVAKPTPPAAISSPAPAAKVPTATTTPKLGNLSAIKNKVAEQQAIQKAQTEQEEEKHEAKAIDAFAFDTQWKNYLLKLTEQGKRSLHSVYKTITPVIELNKVRLEVSNNSELTQAEEDRLNLLSFLKDSLDNRSIFIEIQLAKQEKQEKNYFTDKEKFEAMAGENPALNELRIKLGLDI
ncbi:MAG: DNA polymerase III subunit gamma/tau, partial [Bacteroidia bacterium]|nr:DNA polymerase III subunit gamma/tau [Bacteroidia bacterium]